MISIAWHKYVVADGHLERYITREMIVRITPKEDQSAASKAAYEAL